MFYGVFMRGEAVLITGGAGYVGSHITLEVLARGHRVVVLDDLSYGHRELIPPEAHLVVGDVRKVDVVRSALEAHDISAVVHCAGLISVGESVDKPDWYYDINVNGTRSLLEAMRVAAVRRLVFSSSAAVYGDEGRPPIPESAPLGPTSPYGEQKLEAERLIGEAASWGLAAVCFRYFNAAGADPAGRSGEWHEPETHLIPRLLEQALGGASVTFGLFGDDYPTRDGTCVRDYIHVTDLAVGHALALDSLRNEPRNAVYNLGSSEGFTVREVIDAVRRVTGADFEVKVAPRRPGDPAALVADTSRARAELGWEPTHSSIDAIVATAWAWEQKRVELCARISGRSSG